MVVRDCPCFGSNPQCPVCGGTGNQPPTNEELRQMREDAHETLLDLDPEYRKDHVSTH